MINASAPTDMPTAIATVEPLLMERLGADELTGDASSSEEAAVGFAAEDRVAVEDRVVKNDEDEIRDAVTLDLDDLVGGGEDADKGINFTVPGFDPRENRLMAPTPGQQLLLNSPFQVA